MRSHSENGLRKLTTETLGPNFVHLFELKHEQSWHSQVSDRELFALLFLVLGGIIYHISKMPTPYEIDQLCLIIISNKILTLVCWPPSPLKLGMLVWLFVRTKKNKILIALMTIGSGKILFSYILLFLYFVVRDFSQAHGDLPVCPYFLQFLYSANEVATSHYLKGFYQ